jgi:hypothetical protein
MKNTKVKMQVLLTPECKNKLEELYRDVGTHSFSVFIEELLEIAYNELVI